MAMDLANQMFAWEDGQLNANQTIALFGALVKNGMAWTLQGMYGRTASALIESGYLSRSGEVLKDAEDN